MGDKYPKNAKEFQVIRQHTHLSDDLIIEEILARLPIKSVVRFKSVSKQWYSTLSSSTFANTHLFKSPFVHPSAPVNTLFIKTLNNYCYLFTCDDDDQISGNLENNLVRLDVDFGIRKDYLHLTGCCNGLICLTPSYFYYGEYFMIWNPATRKLHNYASHGYSNYVDKGDKIDVATGFGYASSVDDYKYVRILTILTKGDRKYAKSNLVHIFSLRENSWRKIDFGHDPLVLTSIKQALPVNETLYWEAGNLIVSFDLGVERFDIIKIDRDKSDLLGVMGGCLSKFNFSETLIGDKLLHVIEPPVIVKSIGLPKGLILDISSEMVGFTKTNKFFVLEPTSRRLGIVDTCTRPMQYTALLRFTESCRIARYVPSLVSPFPVRTEKTSEA